MPSTVKEGVPIEYWFLNGWHAECLGERFDTDTHAELVELLDAKIAEFNEKNPAVRLAREICKTCGWPTDGGLYNVILGVIVKELGSGC